MKSISLLSVLATLAAAALLPLRLEVVAYFGFTAAIGCIWAQDYSARRPLRFGTMKAASSALTARDVFRPRVTFRAPALPPSLASESHRLAA